ncbi:MAG: hypothetical protein K2X00_11065 [Nitrospiraceae bacterium]|nr:hypothetical protein [Nitrospiraceae bacterium]
MTFRKSDTIRLTRPMGNLAESETLTVTTVDRDGVVYATHADGRSAMFRDPSMRIELVAREPRIPPEFVLPLLLVAACLAFGLWRLIF